MKKFSGRHSLALPTVLLVMLTLGACSSSSDSSADDSDDSDDIEDEVAEDVDAGPSFRVARIDIDAGNDGTVDQQFFEVYDSQGLLISEFFDSDLDGVADREFSFVYQGGNLFNVADDADLDGTRDFFTFFSYDNNGVLLTETAMDGLNGPEVQRIDYLQDTSGQLTGANFDLNADGAVDEVASYTFNSAGTVDVIEFDQNLDNVTDLVISFEYGEVGEVLTRTSQLADSTITSVWTYVYEEGACDPLSERQPRIVTCVNGLFLPPLN